MTNKIIPYGRQNITQEDIDAVVKVLKSDYLTQGPEDSRF
jgi:dTDP-4-amino-4,6-dideoxygalactose transaminase